MGKTLMTMESYGRLTVRTLIIAPQILMLLLVAYTKDDKCTKVCPASKFCQVDSSNKGRPLACSSCK